MTGFTPTIEIHLNRDADGSGVSFCGMNWGDLNRFPSNAGITAGALATLRITCEIACGTSAGAGRLACRTAPSGATSEAISLLHQPKLEVIEMFYQKMTIILSIAAGVSILLGTTTNVGNWSAIAGWSVGLILFLLAGLSAGRIQRASKERSTSEE